jgi:hypothetical protein
LSRSWHGSGLDRVLGHYGKYVAGAGLAFDKYNGDEVIGIRYNDENGTRTASLRILDQPDAPPAEQKKNFEEARKPSPISECRSECQLTRLPR